MKKITLALAATLFSSPVLAGPYVNVETKTKYTGSEYKSRATDLHVGYTNKLGELAYYIQGGKTIKADDGKDSASNWSGKTGASFPVSEKLKVYGELNFAQVEGADNNWGTKLGTKFTF